MDTITHIALGACIGELVAGRKLGKKAIIIGAVANSLPDIDVVAASWLTADENVLAHRGFTHSLLFAVLVSLLLAYICRRVFISSAVAFKAWLFFFITELTAHIFLDSLNAYGTAWFEPFSHYRVSFNTIFVADPLFSLWIGIAFLVLLVLKRNHTKKKWVIAFGLGISNLYLLYCVINKVNTNADVKAQLRAQNIHYTSYFTTPTPFNNFLWYVVAGNDSGFYTGYYSVFAPDKKIDLYFFPRNDSLIKPIRNEDEVKNLLRFSQGFYTVERWNDTLVFNDLRFGQIVGWQKPDAKFVFHYFLQRPGANALVLQRGRFENWDGKATESLINRIKGK
jgi:inner membrane protein